MKDEVRGNIINELVGLKLKTHSLIMVDDKENKGQCTTGPTAATLQEF